MVLLAAYFEKQGGFHLIIAQDKEEAAYVYNDLQKIIESKIDERLLHDNLLNLLINLHILI